MQTIYVNLKANFAGVILYIIRFTNRIVIQHISILHNSSLIMPYIPKIINKLGDEEFYAVTTILLDNPALKIMHNRTVELICNRIGLNNSFKVSLF